MTSMYVILKYACKISCMKYSFVIDIHLEVTAINKAITEQLICMLLQSPCKTVSLHQIQLKTHRTWAKYIRFQNNKITLHTGTWKYLPIT